MTPRLLDFAPAAWQAYQGQRAHAMGSRLKQALEWLTADPASVRADPRARRYQIIEEQLRQPAEVWGLLVDAPDDTSWLVVWREIEHVIEIGYVGPADANAPRLTRLTPAAYGHTGCACSSNNAANTSRSPDRTRARRPGLRCPGCNG